MSKQKFFIFLFLFFSIILKANFNTPVFLYKLTSRYIGKKGTLTITADPSNTFKEDTTMKTYFQPMIRDTKNTYNNYVKCGFFKFSDGRLYVFCNMDTSIPAGKYSLDFNGIPSFKYQDYEIQLISYNNKFEFEKLDKDLVDLYANKQTINILEGKDSYELKFNVLSYNQEVLMLQTLGNVFMNCRQENNDLNCEIKKDDLEKGLNENYFKSNVYYRSDATGGSLTELPLVGEVTIIDNITQKTDVFVGITRLLENITEGDSMFAYETNVTNINKVISTFEDFRLNFINEYNDTDRSDCSLRKFDDNPLLIVCFRSNIGKCWLNEIKEEIKVEDANIRYNFRIQPVKNDERIYQSKRDRGTFMFDIFPETLDFTNKEYLYIYYNAERTKYLKGITFNKDKEDLDCEITKDVLLRCNVTKNQFNKTGYYFTKRTNHLGSKSTNYEISPVKVILKGSFYSISLYYILLLILIMI